MVRQGDIIKVSFDPQKGHEQKDFRPAVVISNDEFIRRTKLAIVCPVTNTDNRFPLHVSLDERTKTTGVILCEHIRTLDLASSQAKKIEKLPEEILRRVIDIVTAEVEIYS
ncbi:MAG: type II toxin-antitoxin system PemK/MazF family toxin [Clostridiales bacterium]|nr:type II toxin-antitoxin system PemK/MazF family toxin [Clostridiales bacterium]